MSDLAPSPVKSGQQASKNQVVLVAILGLALLIAVVFFVVKPFGGGSDDATAPAVTATGDTTGVTTPAPEAPTTTALPPAPPRNRNPFDPPR